MPSLLDRLVSLRSFAKPGSEPASFPPIPGELGLPVAPSVRAPQTTQDRRASVYTPIESGQTAYSDVNDLGLYFRNRPRGRAPPPPVLERNVLITHTSPDTYLDASSSPGNAIQKARGSGNCTRQSGSHAHSYENHAPPIVCETCGSPFFDTLPDRRPNGAIIDTFYRLMANTIIETASETRALYDPYAERLMKEVVAEMSRPDFVARVMREVIASIHNDDEDMETAGFIRVVDQVMVVHEHKAQVSGSGENLGPVTTLKTTAGPGSDVLGGSSRAGDVSRRSVTANKSTDPNQPAVGISGPASPLMGGGSGRPTNSLATTSPSSKKSKMSPSLAAKEQGSAHQSATTESMPPPVKPQNLSRVPPNIVHLPSEAGGTKTAPVRKAAPGEAAVPAPTNADMADIETQRPHRENLPDWPRPAPSPPQPILEDYEIDEMLSRWATRDSRWKRFKGNTQAAWSRLAKG